jgi:hypothetical protein
MAATVNAGHPRGTIREIRVKTKLTSVGLGIIRTWRARGQGIGKTAWYAEPG